jgi:hypothetical protein
MVAAGNLREVARENQPGASGVAAGDWVDSSGAVRKFIVITDFDNNELVPFRLLSEGTVLRVPRIPVCNGPRAPIVSKGQSPLARFLFICSRSNEVAGYAVTPGGDFNSVFLRPSGGTDPTAVALTPDDNAAVVAHRGGNPVVYIDLGSEVTYQVFGSDDVHTIDDVFALGMDNYDFGDAGNRYLAYVGSTAPNQVATVGIDRDTSNGDVIATAPLTGSPTALAPADELPIPPTGSSPQAVAGRGKLLYVGVRSSQAGVQDQIITYRVGSAGELTLVGSIPAGIFLTDIEVTYDRLFAVTVTPAGRDEVRVFRRRGAQLVLDTSLEMPETAPSFKQIAVTPSEGRVANLFVTGYQGGWMRSILYTRDDDPACTSASEVFCANGNRFEVSVDWAVPTQSRAGKAVSVPITADTGSFWFFTPNNIELVVKVVDGRAFNDFFWVFYGALSDVRYTITVTDTWTGRIRRYVNPQGNLASVADVTAFPEDGGSTATASPPKPQGSAADLAREGSAEIARLLSPGSPRSSQVAFQVRIDWRVPSQETSGVGHGVLLTSDTAYFWFFSPSNVEVVLKVVDGRAVNGRYWVFFGALSDVEYTVTVTNTETGAVRTYFNPSGTLASVADTSAF